MYCYLYDEFIQEHKRFERELMKIENRLTDLGIAGKVSRLALFRDAEEMIRDEIDRGVNTIVVVGNDETVRKVVDVAAESHVVLGLIPIGPNNELASLLGIPEGVAACDVLSARRIETIDVGTVNGRRFITGLSIPHFHAEITCEDKFRVTAVARQAELEIRNFARTTNPRDGRFEAVIRAAVKKGWAVFGRTQLKESVLPLTSMAIRSDIPISLYVEGEEMTSNRFDIGIEPLVLRVIAGKARVF